MAGAWRFRRSRGLHRRGPVAEFAAMLFQHPHIGHHHAAIGRLAHVVDGQQPDLHGRQRLHLDPGLADRFDLGAAVNGAGGFTEIILPVPLIGTKLGQDFCPA